MELLQKQKDPFVLGSPVNIAHSVVYAVICVNECHWLAIEACVRTKEVLVYDPALERKRVGSASPDRYFVRLGAVIDLLLCDRGIRSSDEEVAWNIQLAEGGQQNLLTDSVNCGVYCLEWIKFRVTTAVRSRLLREDRKSVV